ncbi:MAG: hypothetical protein P8L79_14640 [Rhodospirillaceae bacterium]|jgi:hypothetical protein|nr:hypothetical protein [Rhodospirillaceae bacterium]
MARKSRKAKLMERAGSVQDPIPETGSLPRPAVFFIIAIVLLLLGVTFGIVVDVVM